MAQLYYRYSTMNAGKSIEVIKVAHNYEERGKRVLALVPGVDDRYGKGKITSRIGLSRDATIVNEDTNILEIFMRENSFDIPVLANGLKNDFKNELFEGSYYMLIYADKIEEIKTICWCGRKATMVARVVDGKFVKSGEQILVGGDDMYVSLCRRHYNEGSLGPNGGRLTPVNTKFLETPHMDSEKE